MILYSCKKNNDISAKDTNQNLPLDSLKTLSTNLPSANYADLTFTNENTGYAITQGLIVKTTNGGQSWTQLSAPMNIPVK